MSDNILPNGDYILEDGCAWLTVGPFSVWARLADEGIVIDVYPVGRELEEPLASTWAIAPEVLVYCDSCGDPIEGDDIVPIETLPSDVESANAGESAMLCRECADAVTRYLPEPTDTPI